MDFFLITLTLLKQFNQPRHWLNKDPRQGRKKMESAKKAKETRIFVLQQVNQVYKPNSHVRKDGKVIELSQKLVSYDLKIEETNLSDFVMESAEETTTPRGVGRKWHIREVEQQCSCWNEDEDTFDPECKKCFHGTEVVYQVWDWGFRGQFPKMIESFDYEDDANDFIYDRTYEFEFLTDDQRDTSYFETKDEAFALIVERMAEQWQVSEEVTRSILRKKEIVAAGREKQKLEWAKKAEEASKINKERIGRIAAEYAALISREENETYKETAARLSQAIGERIETAVFHAAVTLIRKKVNL